MGRDHMICRIDEIEMVQRHVAQGERHLQLQHRILAHLQEIGAPTEVAQELERQFEEILKMHRQHLARLEVGQPHH